MTTLNDALRARKHHPRNPTLVGILCFACIALISVSAAGILKYLNMFDVNTLKVLVAVTILACITVAIQMHKIDKYLKKEY